MVRVALYARYSSDLQRDASIEDQLRLCEARARKEGWTIVKTYADRAISGASLMRPAIQELLTDAIRGAFDVVLTESIDRLSRDQEGIAHIYKRITHAEVQIITLTEGPINELHVGLKGTMGALYLKDLAQKTRRGMEGRALQGKAAGGNCYGYDVVRRLDSNGEPVKGERTINEQEAAIILRIFEDYVKGKSPKRIALELNKAKVPGPLGKGWGQTTLNGNRKRGTGILNNELYIGRLVWNRQRFVKDPDTGKRIARPNPPEEWIISEVPELRIVPQDLWDQVRVRQEALEHDKSRFWVNQRPPMLFSYILKCGCCGGGFSKISSTHYGCSNARNKGTCDNRLAIAQVKLETSVLTTLQTHLMDPKLCAAFCEEYTRHMNRLRIEQNTTVDAYESELAKLDREIDKLVDSIARGIDPALIKDKVNGMQARRLELRHLVATTEKAPVLIHPNMGHRYHEAVQNLIGSLNDPEHRSSSAELIRKLIDRIVLTPNEDKSALVVDVLGDLAGILRVAELRRGVLTNKSPENLDFSRLSELQQAKMVAGARFELTTFRL